MSKAASKCVAIKKKEEKTIFIPPFPHFLVSFPSSFPSSSSMSEWHEVLPSVLSSLVWVGRGLSRH